MYKETKIYYFSQTFNTFTDSYHLAKRSSYDFVLNANVVFTCSNGPTLTLAGLKHFVRIGKIMKHANKKHVTLILCVLTPYWPF